MHRKSVWTRTSLALASVVLLALLIAPGSASGARTAKGLVSLRGSVAQTAELAAADGAANDGLGTAVAISGSTAVVGAPSHTVGSNAGQGAAYVFSNASGSWKQTAELTASDGAAGDAFGSSVAIDGGTIVIGAPNRAEGGAYVFTNTTGSWKQVAEVYDPSQKANDQFGFSVAISGGTLVVGTMISPAGTELEGAVYVFSNASGNWQQTAYLTLASLPPTTSSATRWRSRAPPSSSVRRCEVATVPPTYSRTARAGGRRPRRSPQLTVPRGTTSACRSPSLGATLWSVRRTRGQLELRAR